MKRLDQQIWGSEDEEDIDEEQNKNEAKVDPYHGKQQELPEPEDFEMPDDLNLDGEEKDDKDGETETENPFEIDAMKEALQEEQKENDDEDKDKGNKNGLEVSSDEEGEGNDAEQVDL
ncbi:unnamed protein product [Danaus chrysippus]|uniref:(African queen) hypothetical protein n=1 Tax=Danaus chrysippus TaxID=151541 RepID=A0A8J2R8S1_9NEOP|nr:unnamed protein product [Danaus chrysippus]